MNILPAPRSMRKRKQFPLSDFCNMEKPFNLIYEARQHGGQWRRLQPVGFVSRYITETPQAEQAAEKVDYFVIPSGARNLSSV
jgi:hypothetical protein